MGVGGIDKVRSSPKKVTLEIGVPDTFASEDKVKKEVEMPGVQKII